MVTGSMVARVRFRQHPEVGVVVDALVRVVFHLYFDDVVRPSLVGDHGDRVHAHALIEPSRVEALAIETDGLCTPISLHVVPFPPPLVYGPHFPHLIEVRRVLNVGHGDRVRHPPRPHSSAGVQDTGHGGGAIH